MTTGIQSAYGLSFHPDSINRLYVCNYNHNYVSVIDTDNYIALDPIIGFDWPIDITFDPNPSNNRFLVSEYQFSSIAYVNKTTSGLIKRLAVINRPEGISFDPNTFNNRYFVAGSSLGQYIQVKEIIG